MQSLFPDSDVGAITLIIVGVIIAQIIIIIIKNFTNRVASKTTDGEQKASGLGISVMIIIVGLILIYFEQQIAISLNALKTDVFFLGLVFIIIGVFIIYFLKLRILRWFI